MYYIVFDRDHVEETGKVKRAEEILIKWLLTETEETVRNISLKTEIDSDILTEMKRNPSKIIKLNQEDTHKLIIYARKLGAEN